MSERVARPAFRYYPGFYDEAEFRVPAICGCCGGRTEASTELRGRGSGPCRACPSCVADGTAASASGGRPVIRHDAVSGLARDVLDELERRTPAYPSARGAHWRACCGDFCEYVGRTDVAELHGSGMYDAVLSEYATNCDAIPGLHDRLSRDFARGQGEGSYNLYLFRCRHCGKPRIWAELK